MKELVVYYKGKKDEEVPDKKEMAKIFHLNEDEFEYLYDVYSSDRNSERKSFNKIVQSIIKKDVKKLYIKNYRHINREIIGFNDFCELAIANNCEIEDSQRTVFTGDLHSMHIEIMKQLQNAFSELRKNDLRRMRKLEKEFKERQNELV